MQVLSDMGAAGAPLQDDYVHEMCRCGWLNRADR
jgi:hypothetical protein